MSTMEKRAATVAPGQGRVVRVVGAMTGTSGDGVDLALVETDGVAVVRTVARAFTAFTAGETALLLEAAERAATLAGADRADPVVAAAETLVTRRHVDALENFAAEAGFDFVGVDVIGMHGQTLFHDPARGISLQVGDARAIAARFAVPVASNFRVADIAGGGQGAPLAPIYHRMLVGEEALPSVVVNIGGVTNITWLGADGGVIGFDTGAGNGALDRFIRARTGEACDRDGRFSAGGTADRAEVDRWMSDPYFAAPPPKSLDRSAVLVDPGPAIGIADGAATLVAFIVEGLAAALRHLPDGGAGIRRWVVAGGGRRNPSILAGMRRRLPGEVVAIEALGHDGDMIEAELFAVLGARRLLGIASAMPRPGGRSADVLLGDLAGP